MRRAILGITPALLMLALAILACNMPQANGASPMPIETVTPTVDGLVPETDTFTPEPTSTSAPQMTETPSPAPTAQDPLVSRAALCWWGPGPVYEVISSLKEGIRVKLVGRGSIPGWLLVDNPTYHVPCWVQDYYLQIDSGTDFSVLPIFTPPPTPTPTKVPTKTPTPTPTPP
ncbi:MAG: hypothetical protein HY863_09555 [Chloroflexi bacterium]|nr:hypothetical protein [Chloroflexota bacterium]